MCRTAASCMAGSLIAYSKFLEVLLEFFGHIGPFCLQMYDRELQIHCISAATCRSRFIMMNLIVVHEQLVPRFAHACSA